MSFDSKQRINIQYNPITLLLVMVFFVLFALTFHFIEKEKATRVQSELDQIAYGFSTDLYKKLNKSVEGLQAVSNVMLHFERIKLEQFKGITKGYFDSEQGLMMVEWQPIVPAAERKKFVDEARKGGLHDFQLWEPDTDGSHITAKHREIHIPVLFMSSRDKSENDLNTLGLDLAWSNERVESKLEARDLGRAQGSELFRVVTGKNSDFDPIGFAITLPVYRNGLVPIDIEQRRTETIGFIAGVYSLENLFKGNIEELTNLGINVEISDSLDNEDRLVVVSGKNTLYKQETLLDLFGNHLYIKLTATPSFVNSQFQTIWLILPVMLIVFGVLSFLFFRQLQAKTKHLIEARKDLEKLNVKLENLSRHDSLTNLLNRRAFLESLAIELECLERHDETIALLMLDIDYFKQINDNWGHPVGDAVLIEFAKSLRDISRKIDIIGRIGGEEFAVILTKTNKEDALSFAERLRLQVSNLNISPMSQNGLVNITVSIGVALTENAMAAEQLISQADKALYAAKRNGRNNVELFHTAFDDVHGTK